MDTLIIVPQILFHCQLKLTEKRNFYKMKFAWIWVIINYLTIIYNNHLDYVVNVKATNVYIYTQEEREREKVGGGGN